MRYEVPRFFAHSFNTLLPFMSKVAQRILDPHPLLRLHHRGFRGIPPDPILLKVAHHSSLMLKHPNKLVCGFSSLSGKVIHFVTELCLPLCLYMLTFMISPYKRWFSCAQFLGRDCDEPS